MDKPIVSVVVRTLNESDSLDKLLRIIKSQESVDISKLEIIVVDNDSSDNTKDIARKYHAKVINLPRNEFNYPKSMNLGVNAARAPIVILTVGHALPIGKHWIASSLPYFDNPKVAGVYGAVLPNKNHGFVEGLMYRASYLKAKVIDPKYNKKHKSGAFAATNLALRKSLWTKHNFDERYELGGEDGHWAEWAYSQGYVIVRDTRFSVYHTHGLSLINFIKQIKYWRSLDKPTKFTKDVLSYRKDIKW